MPDTVATFKFMRIEKRNISHSKAGAEYDIRQSFTNQYMGGIFWSESWQCWVLQGSLATSWALEHLRDIAGFIEGLDRKAAP
ncbi:MAG: hypothetical protein WC683_05950 [bacterium]